MAGSPRTAKFARRRSEILDAACELINDQGVRGMTLTAVARELGLDTSSVTYYFKRKDVLAAACIERTLDWMAEAAHAAAAEPDQRSRVRRFLRENISLLMHQRQPEVRELALLSDMRALDSEARAPLDAKYADILRVIRNFFDAPRSEEGRLWRGLASVVFVNCIHWIPAWLDRYLIEDSDRVEQRMFDLLDKGIAIGPGWSDAHDQLEQADLDDPQTRFLHAATDLINRHGYLGASVERIAAELGVSTGSFYHHIDNKDDLVVDCFNRSFSMTTRAAAMADAEGGTQGQRLARMLTSLMRLQLLGTSPMLRNSAYQALPPDLRLEMLQRTGQVTRHIAGRISDGIADGSLRAVDAPLASHLVVAMINGAGDLRSWLPVEQAGATVAAYRSMLQRGIFRD